MRDTRHEGRSHPLGASVQPRGVNFSLFSKDATAVELLLFDGVDDARPARTVALDPRRNRTYDYWHLFVPDVRPGQLYGYRVDGPFRPRQGLRFAPDKLLLDPYARAVAVPEAYSRQAARTPGDNVASAMKSVVVDPGRYDWEDDMPLARPLPETVIYEMHVRGFTRHPSSGVALEKRGTYAGLIDRIPYLEELGITAVELLPVFHFDAQDAPPGLVNYWGYAPVSFFAPHLGYASRRDPLAAVDEFRDMVKALHRAGIEVILDVVYNHTAEGGADGPTLAFKGLANDVYYILPADRARYADYTGTGNTLNANHPVVRRMILDSLRTWAQEMHVDGFRFDLASVLSRDETGQPLDDAPVLWDIETDPALAGVKLIAEAWDPAGLYQVGTFLGHSWKEWNGKFRDDVRSFIRGDQGTVRRLAMRLLGSPDLYGHEEREPEQSVNFVTCHDGFTLNDLVSYDDKHNEANGEGNRDGYDDNRSWNCGVEGPTDDPEVERLRNRQVKNFLAIELLALGAPMLLMGDEVRRTQRGNNNAYCQDNDVSWLDWSFLDRHADVLRFVRHLVRARLQRMRARDIEGLSLNELLRRARIEWHGVRLHQPDWREVSHTLAFTAPSPEGGLVLHAMLSAYWEPLDFELPPVPGGSAPGESGERSWRRWIDTSLDAPGDIVALEEAPPMSAASYRVGAHAVVVLVRRGMGEVSKGMTEDRGRSDWTAA
jgi:glycogen operon protein